MQGVSPSSPFFSFFFPEADTPWHRLGENEKPENAVRGAVFLFLLLSFFLFFLLPQPTGWVRRRRGAEDVRWRRRSFFLLPLFSPSMSLRGRRPRGQRPLSFFFFPPLFHLGPLLRMRVRAKEGEDEGSLSFFPSPLSPRASPRDRRPQQEGKVVRSFLRKRPRRFFSLLSPFFFLFSFFWASMGVREKRVRGDEPSLLFLLFFPSLFMEVCQPRTAGDEDEVGRALLPPFLSLFFFSLSRWRHRRTYWRKGQEAGGPARLLPLSLFLFFPPLLVDDERGPSLLFSFLSFFFLFEPTETRAERDQR